MVSGQHTLVVSHTNEEYETLFHYTYSYLLVTNSSDVRVEELREPKERNADSPPIRLDFAIAVGRRHKEG